MFTVQKSQMGQIQSCCLQDGSISFHMCATGYYLF